MIKTKMNIGGSSSDNNKEIDFEPLEFLRVYIFCIVVLCVSWLYEYYILQNTTPYSQLHND